MVIFVDNETANFALSQKGHKNGRVGIAIECVMHINYLWLLDLFRDYVVVLASQRLQDILVDIVGVIDRNVMAIEHLIETLLDGAHDLLPLIDTHERIIEPWHAVQKLDSHLVDDVQVIVELVFLDLFGQILLLLRVWDELHLLPFLSYFVVLTVHLLATEAVESALGALVEEDFAVVG